MSNGFVSGGVIAMGGAMPKVMILVAATTFAVVGCDEGSGYRAGQEAGYNSMAGASSAEPARRRFTKTEFSNYVYGKTKAQLRAEFGSPMSVDDSTDSWTYGPNIQVYDDQAGSSTMVKIRFIGLEGPDDEAVSVRYF